MGAKTFGAVLSIKDEATPTLQQIVKQTGLTTKEAKKLRGELITLNKEVSAKFKEIGSSVTKGLAIAAAGAAALVLKAGETVDRIDDMSNKIGVSRKFFQEWDYLLKQNGASIDSLQMGMKTLVNQVDGVTKGNKNSILTFKALGLSIRDNSGKLKNQEQIFNEVVSALQKMPDGVQKAKIANDLLGRSGSELMPLFNSTNEVLVKQREEYKKLGIEISDETIDAGNAFGDTMEKMKAAMGSLTASLAAELLPIANQLLTVFITEMPKIKETITPIINGVAGVLGFLVEHIKMVTFVTTLFVSQFAMVKTVAAVSSSIQFFSKVVRLATIGQKGLNTAMKMSPFGIVLTIINAVTVAVIALVQNFDDVKKAFNGFVDSVKGFFNKDKKTSINITTETENKNKTTNTIEQKYATGTSYAQGGLALVGENGPELVNLKRGTSVLPTTATQNILKQNDIIINLTVQGSIIGNKEFIDNLKNILGQELKKALAV